MQSHKRLSYKAILICVIISTMVLTLILVHTSDYWVGYKVIRYANMAPRETPHQHYGSKNWGLEGEPFSDGATGRKYSESEDSDSLRGVLSRAEPTTGLKPETKQYSKTGDQAYQYLVPKSVNQGALRVQGGQTNQILRDIHRPPQQASSPIRSKTDKALKQAIRKQTKESARLSRKYARRNMYYFNDRNVTSYQTLPLSNHSDPEWKQDEAVIFNRVGKCGSRSIIQLLEKLSDLNNFNLISSIVYDKMVIGSNWQKYIVQTLDEIRTPYLFQRHLHFINFRDFNLRQPLYINIIRDPLDRFVSSYYYYRFGDEKSDSSFKGSGEARHRSVTDCVLQRYKECVIGGAMNLIPFFCGQEKACRRPSKWALDQAKRNVEKYFIVVGILEDLDNTLRLFEKILPRFFKGVVDVYKTMEKDEMNKITSTATKKKEKPSVEAKAIMKHLMRYDYDFYNWVKERLEKMKKQYGIV